MRCLLTILFVFSFLIGNAQDNQYENELKQLQQKLENVEHNALKITIIKDIIQLSLPNQYKNVYKYSEQLLELAEIIHDTESKAYAYRFLGEYYYSIDDFEKAKYYYMESLSIYEMFSNTSQNAHIYYNLGLANQYLNQYDEALVYYQKSIALFESFGNNDKVAICYHDLGTLYNDLEKYSLAQYYYEKALDIYTKANNTERIAAIYQNIGVLYYNWGDYDKSLELYKKSLKIYENTQDKKNIAISLSNIGLVYEENKQYTEALEYYQNALIIFEEINFKPTLVYIFYNLGSIYRNLHNNPKSIEYFEKGLKLSAELSMKDYISYFYEALSGIFEDQKQYAKSLQYYKNYVQVKDSLFNEEKFKQIEEIDAQYQTAKHLKENEFLKLDKELKETELKKKEAQILVLIFSSFLTLIIVLILILYNRSQKKISNKLETEVRERIKTEEQLHKIKDDLEIRVKTRTFDLEQTNTKLKQEIKDHEITLGNLKLAKNKAEESDRIKTHFLANMSHEVRTPMNAIAGFSQMLAFDNISPNKRNNYINLIQEGCSSLTNLIDDIVDFAAIESGEAKIEMKEFNPHPILEYINDHFTNEIVKSNKDSLILTYANENKESDLTINSDPARLKQILSILIDNAIKFTEQGHVEFGFVHPNESEIQFYVRDTGIGIDEKYSDLVFERFRQIDEGTTKKYEGAGIGLSVAKNLVELINGKLWFESTLGKGASFYFQIPHIQEGNVPVIIQPQNFNWIDKAVLVVEDKKINFEIIRETLSVTNVELLWAKNGVEAIEFVESKANIDLILMDIQMPVMDGYETTRRIKAMKSIIPIIAQTAYALPQDSYKCIDAGCDDYISKPISMNQFLIKLDKYLS